MFRPEAAAEMAMRDVGIAVQPGSGVAAATEYWRTTAAPIPGRPVVPLPEPAPRAADNRATAAASR